MAQRQAEYERQLMKRPASGDETWTTTYRWVPGRELDEATRRVLAEMAGVFRERNEGRPGLAEVLWTVS